MSGIAKSVLLVTKVWLGWKLVIDGVRLIVNKFFELTLAGIEGTLGGIGRLVSVFDKDLAASIETARRAAAGLGEEFAMSGDDAADSMQKTAAQIKTTEEAMKNFETTAVAAINRAAAAADKQVGSSIAGTRRTEEERQMAVERAEQRAALIVSLEERTQSKLAGIEQANFQRRVELTNGLIQRDEEAAAKRLELSKGLANDLGAIAGEVFAEQALGQRTAEEAAVQAAKSVLKVTLATVRRIIIARAAQGAASQGAAVAGTGAGLIVAPAAAAAMFALLSAFVNRLEHGGIVTGGMPGRDSVPALLTPGEVVIPAPVVRQFAGKPAQTFNQGGFVTAQRGGVIPTTISPAPTTQVNLTLQSLIPTSTAEAKKAAREFGRELSKLNQRGMFSLQRG